MAELYSYHVFYFPFKWKIKNTDSVLFGVQTDLMAIEPDIYSDWQNVYEEPLGKEAEEFYNENNYFYEFVHPVLYNKNKKGGILKHYERKEPQQKDVFYRISVKDGKTYSLKVDAINLNLYATGVGMLSFFLKNEEQDQGNSRDILSINQYGRRLFPPYIADLESRVEIAQFIAIEGLNGNSSRFYEDFSGYTPDKSWQPACFVENLISDLCDNLIISPVIDDRMFVNCWYGNNELSQKVNTLNINKDQRLDFSGDDDFWYKYVYIDVNSITCQDREMRKKLICLQTYKRWKDYGMLYGASRYSFVLLSKNDDFHKNVFAVHMRTMYSRMIELILIQRASTLRFSDEVARVSRLSKKHEMDKDAIEQISSLYKEYIRFINQIHFREVTAQDQGIELYQLLSQTLKIEDYVEDLDKELAELNQYVNLLDDKVRNRNAEKLNIIAAIFLPATLMIGIFNMGASQVLESDPSNFLLKIPFIGKLGIVGLATIVMYGLLQLIKKNK